MAEENVQAGGAQQTEPAAPQQQREIAVRAPQIAREESAARSLAFMDPQRWALMGQIASAFIQSKSLPEGIANAPQLMMVLQAGFEAGLQPVESVNSFYFVNGKLTMYGDTVVAQVIKAGHRVVWGECDANKATVTIIRADDPDQIPHSSTLTMDDVVKRGINVGRSGVKEPWKKYPESMLKYRAFGMLARFVCPDALRGVKIKEELEGEIEVLPPEVKPAETQTPTAAVPTTGHKPLGEEIAAADEKEAQPEPAAEKPVKAARREKKATK